MDSAELPGMCNVRLSVRLCGHLCVAFVRLYVCAFVRLCVCACVRVCVRASCASGWKRAIACFAHEAVSKGIHACVCPVRLSNNACGQRFQQCGTSRVPRALGFAGLSATRAAKLMYITCLRMRAQARRFEQ